MPEQKEELPSETLDDRIERARQKRASEKKKHLVPAELKQVLLEILYTLGIDRSRLFPDPDGLCARINWETKNGIERNFPPVSGTRM
jgi:hypothetical protein